MNMRRMGTLSLLVSFYLVIAAPLFAQRGSGGIHGGVASLGSGRALYGGYRRGYGYGRYAGFGYGYGLASLPFFYDNYWQGEAYDQSQPSRYEVAMESAEPPSSNDQRLTRATAIVIPQAKPLVIEVPDLEEFSSGEPLPAAVFIFSNGNQMEARRFTLTSDSLAIDIGPSERRTFPLTALNVQATLSANSERGISLKIPEDRNHIAVGF
ncbi:MAG: hypothetical protein ABSD20_08815 [Terriglobales bacterium]|jgi:hypothetical protein